MVEELRLPDKEIVSILDQTIHPELQQPPQHYSLCDTNKNLKHGKAKWCNFIQASGGSLFMVRDNCASMRNIRSEINYCLGKKSVAISLTNLADLQGGNRGEGDSNWLEARNRG